MTGCGGPPEPDVPVVFAGHDDRAAVRRPERAHVQGATGPIERAGETRGAGGAIGRDDVEPHVAAVRVLRRSCEVGDRAAVRRERGEHDGPGRRGETLRCSSLGVHTPEITRVVVVTLRVTGRGEHERATVRGPRWIGVDEVTVGDLHRRRAVGRDDEDVRAPVVGEPLAVEAILHGCDDARGPRLALLFFAVRLALATDRGHAGQARTVRRPCHAPDTVLERRQLGRLAAVGRHHVELELVRGRALGEKREPCAVRRPPRLDVAPRPGRKATRRAAGRIDHPDVGEVLVALLGQ